MQLVSVVIPVYNEQKCLPVLIERLRAVAASGTCDYEYVFVDDGSSDASLQILQELAARYDNVKYISFSRNFGHEAATTAGVDHANGDAVVIIDADLQHPPEVIPELIQKWIEGYQVVYARRRSRTSETKRKRLTSFLFYRLIRALSDVDIPPDTGDFRLMDRRVAQHFRRCREQGRFVRGLIAWTGFRQTAVLYDEERRYAGQTKYGAIKLLLLAGDAILGFSNFPLRIVVLLGLFVLVLAAIGGTVIAVQKVIWGIPVPMYATLATGIGILASMNLLAMGLLGEYIGRIYRQTQDRPLYIIADKSDLLPSGDEGWVTSTRPLRPSRTAGPSAVRASLSDTGGRRMGLRPLGVARKMRFENHA